MEGEIDIMYVLMGFTVQQRKTEAKVSNLVTQVRSIWPSLPGARKAFQGKCGEDKFQRKFISKEKKEKCYNQEMTSFMYVCMHLIPFLSGLTVALSTSSFQCT